jgi:hypothetical protein
MGAKLLHADRQTNMTKLIVAFRNFANAPENEGECMIQATEYNIWKIILDYGLPMLRKWNEIIKSIIWKIFLKPTGFVPLYHRKIEAFLNEKWHALIRDRNTNFPKKKKNVAAILREGYCTFTVNWKVKAKLSLSTPRRRIVGVEVQLHSFLTSALDGGKWSTSSFGHFIPDKTRCPLEAGSVPDPFGTVLEKRKYLTPDGI